MIRYRLSSDVFCRKMGDSIFLWHKRKFMEWNIRLPNRFFSLVDYIPRDYKTIYEIVEKHPQYEKDNLEGLKESYLCLFEQIEPFLDIDYSEIEEDEERTNSLYDKKLFEGAVKEFYKFNFLPQELHIDLTTGCNERCVHCYIPDHNNQQFLDINTFKRVINDFVQNQGLTVYLSGGEPMLHPQFKEMVKYCYRKNLNIVIMSNLTLCDDAMVNLLKEIDPQFVNVSLYSMVPEHHDAITTIKGSWQKTMSAILKLKENGIHVRLAAPVLKENKDDFEELFKFAQEHHMHLIPDCDIYAKCNQDTSNLDHALSPEELEDFLSKNSRYYSQFMWNENINPDDKVCDIGETRINIDSKGNFYPCDGTHELTLGNASKLCGIVNAWRCELFEYLRELKNKNFGECSSCEYRKFCKVCPAHNYNATGDIFKHLEQRCQYAKIKKKLFNKDDPLICLSKNTFVRNYGDFTYVICRLKLQDKVYKDAGMFFKWITRTPTRKSQIISNILNVYVDVDRSEIENDFNNFLQDLQRMKAILIGNTIEVLKAQEEYFSYDVENPKTLKKDHQITKEEFEIIPQNVLGKYFDQNPTLFRLQMDITQACTERCIHCYIPEYNPIFLPYEQICKIIDEFVEMGGLEITFSGGECMLHPKFDEIIRYAYSKDLIIGILSNLTLCDDDKIKLLKETDATVQVSLYSMNSETHDAITQRSGSWVKTKTAIEKLRQNQIPCRISCPTMKQNYKDYLDVLDFAKSLKMSAQTDFIIMGKMDGDTSNLSCRLNLSETREILRDIIFKSVPMNSEYFNPNKKENMLSAEEWMKCKVCGAGTDSLCIDACGNYYPCPAFGTYILGNCYKKTLKCVWFNSDEIKKLRNVRGKDFPKCASCKDRDYCSVCMCRNVNETGNIFKPAEHFCKVAEINHELVDERQKIYENM